MCKHNWVLALPHSVEIEESKRVDYAIEVLVLGGALLRRIVYCDNCNRTGHSINSRRSGVRIHSTDGFLIQVNKLREKYGLPLLSSEQSVQESDTTEA